MKLATIKELSAFLQVKVNTLYSWVHSETIPYYKLNGLLRFDMAEIEEWVGKSRQSDLRGNVAQIRPKNVDINSIVKNAVEGVTGKGYNPLKRETRPASRSQKEGGFDETF